MNRASLIGVVGILAVAAAVFIFTSSDSPVPESGQSVAGPPLVDVTVPTLTAAEQSGEIAFNKNCASCHGVNAAGQDGVAPPLVHKIYEPSHHGDASFVLAAKQGVRQHHWPFGNMPAVPGITDEEILDIINYVRALQRANGIT